MTNNSELADSTTTIHTPTMSLKTASFLGLVGMVLLTILLAADCVNVVTGVMRDVVPTMALLMSLVYLVAGLTVTVFFYVFQKDQA